MPKVIQERYFLVLEMDDGSVQEYEMVEPANASFVSSQVSSASTSAGKTPAGMFHKHAPVTAFSGGGTLTPVEHTHGKDEDEAEGKVANGAPGLKAEAMDPAYADLNKYLSLIDEAHEFAKSHPEAMALLHRLQNVQIPAGACYVDLT